MSTGCEHVGVHLGTVILPSQRLRQQFPTEKVRREPLVVHDVVDRQPHSAAGVQGDTHHNRAAVGSRHDALIRRLHIHRRAPTKRDEVIFVAAAAHRGHSVPAPGVPGQRHVEVNSTRYCGAISNGSGNRRHCRRRKRTRLSRCTAKSIRRISLAGVSHQWSCCQ